MQGGCSGSSLGLVHDEPKNNDKIFDNSSLKFLIEKRLLETCGSIDMEFIDAGPRSEFGITSEIHWVERGAAEAPATPADVVGLLCPSLAGTFFDTLTEK